MISIAILIKLITETVHDSDSSMSTALVLAAIFLLFNISAYKMFVIGLINLIWYILRIITHFTRDLSWNESLMLILHYTVILSSIFLISSLIGRVQEKESREKFKLLKQIGFHYQRSHSILNNLLPDFVVERVQRNIKIVEEHTSVTILFCNICNFESICNSRDSSSLIEVLDKFFSKLDRLCFKFGVAKIETVNKTYMACGGLSHIEDHLPVEMQVHSHAERCIDMAIAIMHKLKSMYLKSGETIEVKIGIHSGPVIAGVVGLHKPQFSLVGDTVNTASRMCSTIKIPGQIQISNHSYELIDSANYILIPSKCEAKGKGTLSTFYIDIFRSNSRVHSNTQSSCSLARTSSQQFLLEKPVNGENNANYSELPKSFDLREFMHDNEENEIPLAGPVQFIECTCDEFDQNRKFRLTYIENNIELFTKGLWVNIVIYTLLTLNKVAFTLEKTGLWFFYFSCRGLCICAMIVFARKYKANFKEHMFL